MLDASPYTDIFIHKAVCLHTSNGEEAYENVLSMYSHGLARHEFWPLRSANKT